MKRAVCAGSFDPITLGHVDLFQRAARLFDELDICVFQNIRKAGMFSAEERLVFIREAVKGLTNVRVSCFSGLLADYMRQREANVIVRGVRSAKDFEYERNQAELNRRLNPDIETVLLFTRPEYACLSSSAVREIVAFHGNLHDMVPECVEKAIKERYRGNRES